MFNRLLHFLLLSLISVTALANQDWLDAAKRGDLEELDRLYEDETQEEAYTLVNPELWQWAAFNDGVEVLDWLNANSCRGTKPGQLKLWLLGASSQGTRVLEWLLKYKIDGRADLNHGGQNLWFQAVKLGSLEVLDWLFAHRDELPPMDAVDEHGRNIWFPAAIRNDPEILEWLQAHGITPPDGSHWLKAAQLGHTKVLEALLRNNIPGAENADADGLNMWWYAVQFNQPDVIDILAQNTIYGAHVTNLWLLAARAGHLEVLKRLAHHRIAGGDTARDRGCLWLIAVSRGFVHILDWLLENNIPGRDAVNIDGEDVFGIANRIGNQDVLRWLERHIRRPIPPMVGPPFGAMLVLPMIIGTLSISSGMHK